MRAHGHAERMAGAGRRTPGPVPARLAGHTLPGDGMAVASRRAVADAGTGRPVPARRTGGVAGRRPGPTGRAEAGTVGRVTAQL